MTSHLSSYSFMLSPSFLLHDILWYLLFSFYIILMYVLLNAFFTLFTSNTSWIVRLHVCWLLQSQTCQKQSSNTVWLHWSSVASTRCRRLSPIPVTQLRLPAKTSSSNSPSWLCIRKWSLIIHNFWGYFNTGPEFYINYSL